MNKRKLESIYKHASMAFQPKSELTKDYQELVDFVRLHLAQTHEKRSENKPDGMAAILRYMHQEFKRSNLGSICVTKAGEKTETDRDKKVVIREMLQAYTQVYDMVVERYYRKDQTPGDLAVVSEGMALLNLLISTCRFTAYDIFRIDGMLQFFLQATAHSQKNLEDCSSEEAAAKAEVEKSIFTNSLHILARLIRMWDGPLDNISVSLLEHILDNAKTNTLYKIVDFFSNILLETPDKHLFQNLKDHNIKLEESKSIFIEAIAVKCTSFLKLILKSMMSFTEVMNILFKTKCEDEFASTLKQLIDQKRIDCASIELKMPQHLQPMDAYKLMFSRLEFTKLHNMVNYFIGASVFNESLFILNTLLASKRKQFFKSVLQKVNFCQKVLQLTYDVYFNEKLDRNEDWSDESNSSQSSNLESIRILFLRVCMNFCDTDNHAKATDMFINHHDKQTMLQLIQPFLKEGHETMTVHQLHQKLFNYNRKDEAVESVLNHKLVEDNIALLLRKPFEELNLEKAGLLVKLLHKMFTAPKNSNYIFAICTFFETYLRGVNPFMQVFFTLGGLLDHLLQSQVKDREENSKMITQIYFDLLGEMVKYNLFTLSSMDSILKAKTITDQFEDLMNSNLIDSNVFVRSCLLTDFYHQTLASEKDTGCYPELGSPMITSVKRDLNRTCKELVTSVTPKNISFENLCCINTVFIIALIQANENHENDPVRPFLEDHLPTESLANFR